jgi:hypothetical protein
VGEGAREILKAVGISDQEVEQLKKEGIVAF